MGYDVVSLPMWAWDEPNAAEILRGDWRPGPTKLPAEIAEAYGLKRPAGLDGPWNGWIDWREPGAILWPEGITEARARTVEEDLGPIDAAAQLQQRPILIAAGGLFPREKIAEHMINFENIPWGEIDKVIRFWDKAGGTSSAADRTAGVCIGRWVKKSPAVGVPPDVRYIVLDVVAGRWNPFERNAIIRQTAAADRRLYGDKVELWLEKEARGGAGIESANISYLELKEFSPRFDAPTQSKLIRARPFSSAWHAGKVWIVIAAWNQSYLAEMEAFSGEDQPGIHDDVVDGSSGASVKLIAASTSRGAPPGGTKAKTGLRP
jgi:predicted phage terminase large subunit-like protein